MSWFRFWYVDENRKRCLWFESRGDNLDDALHRLATDLTVQSCYPDFDSYKLAQIEWHVKPGGPKSRKD